MSLLKSAIKACAEQDGIQKSVNVEERSTEPLSNLPMKESMSSKNVSLVELAEKLGFSKIEIYRFQRIKNNLYENRYPSDAIPDIHFLALCLERMLKKFVPPHTAEEIAAMHNF